jgi:hypothetical protein
MSKDQFKMPEPKAVLRNGDALLEMHHEGEVVGEFNFSKVLRKWWKTANQKTGLEVAK